jgi:hypothetical protein
MKQATNKTADNADKAKATPPYPRNPRSNMDWQERFHLLVDCRNEANQRKLYEQFTAQGFDCRVLVL